MVPILLPFSCSPLLTRLCSLPPLTAPLQSFPCSFFHHFLHHSPPPPPSINQPLHQSLPHSVIPFFLHRLLFPPKLSAMTSLFSSPVLIYQCLHDFPLHLSNSQPSPPLPIKLSTLSTLHLFICLPQSCRCLFFALSSFSITKT